MPTPLSSHFESVRLGLGLKPGEVAARAGWRDAGIGGSRLKEFERDGIASDATIARWAAALGIPQETIDALEGDERKRARAEWQAWAAEPMEPRLTIRPFSGLWIGRPLPEDLRTREEIEHWVRNVCEYRSLLRCVQWSRIHATFFREDGTSWENDASFGEDGPGPTMSIR
ncbi:MAG: hypothetical protein ACKOGJ_08440 [Phycisphaerales bacterium]